jgi:aminoglycoside/choline kinase family phosphotransferase
MSADPKARQEHALAFVARAGWGDAQVETLPGDASTRRYTRLRRSGSSAMLMDQPPGAETASCPPDASEAQREALGYNAMARLAGPDCRPFAAISQFLRKAGLSAPEILAHDYDAGFLLIEDFGDGRMADLILGGQAEAPFYETAMDTLAHLHRTPAPRALPVPGGGEVRLLSYDVLAMLAEVRLLPTWFYPAATGRSLSNDAVAAFDALWREALGLLQVGAPVMILRDYHAENLMWLAARTGTARAGLLDFQDALSGSAAYDVISMTEDARRDVSPALADAMVERYIQRRRADDPAFDAEAFRFAAALLAAQRNTKIVGIFARLWKRDGKARYRQFLPRMWRYLERDLSHPAMAGLRGWFDRHVPQEYRGIPGSDPT